MGWYCGIDPGVSGAVALYEPDLELLEIADMPVYAVQVGRKSRNRLDPNGLLSVLSPVGRGVAIHRALVEDVHSLPKDGAVGAFTFGYGCGAIDTVLAAVGVPYDKVRPNVWKKEFGLRSEKDESRRAASREFPHYADLWSAKKHHGRAEAALLALRCARGK